MYNFKYNLIVKNNLICTKIYMYRNQEDKIRPKIAEKLSEQKYCRQILIMHFDLKTRIR